MEYLELKHLPKCLFSMSFPKLNSHASGLMKTHNYNQLLVFVIGIIGIYNHTSVDYFTKEQFASGFERSNGWQLAKICIS